jgi:hypothetical protein
MTSDFLTKVPLVSTENIIVDGEPGTQITRLWIGGEPAVRLQHKELNKAVIITAPMLKQINGWLAKLVAEEIKATKH